MVLERLKALLAEQFDVEESEISADTNLVEDLDADSIDVVELIMAIESEFDITVPESEVDNIRTVGDVAKYIETLL